MDTVTARDYIHAYPQICLALSKRPRPPFGWQESDIYKVLEEEIGIRDSRIAELENLISGALESMSDSRYGEPEITGRARTRLRDAVNPQHP